MSQSQYPYKTDNPIVNHWNYLNGTMGRWDAGRFLGHLHNHVGLTENFDQSENEEFLVNDSP